MRKLDLGQAEEPEAGPEPESGAAEPETEPETEPELEVGALKTDVADSKKRTQGALRGTVRARVPLPCPDTCRQVLGCTRPCTRVLLEA